MARKKTTLTPAIREQIREEVKRGILEQTREATGITRALGVFSPVTRPFVGPVKLGIDRSTQLLLDSGALDNAIEAKINELAAQRGYNISGLENKSRSEVILDLADAGIDIFTDPEVVRAANEIIDAPGEPRFSAGIRRQFSRANSAFGQLMPDEPVKKTRKKTKNDKNMSKALEEANKRLRKINGGLRKGKSQSDVMRLAQRLAKKMR